MLVYRGMDIGTAKPTSARASPGPAPPDRSRRAVRTVHAWPGSRPWDGPSVTAGGRARRVPALLVGGSGLYLRAVVDDLGSPARGPADTRGSSSARRPRWAPSACTGACDAAIPRPRPRSSPRTSAARSVRSRSRPSRAARSAASPRRGSGYPDDRVRAAGVRMTRRRAADPGSPTGCSAMFAAGSGSRRSAGSSSAGSGSWLTSTQAIGYAEFGAHLDGRLTLDEAVERTDEREPATSPGARWRGSGAIHGSAGSRPVRAARWTCVDEVRTYLGRRGRERRPRVLEVPGDGERLRHGRRPRRRPSAPSPRRSRRCATAGPASAPTA